MIEGIKLKDSNISMNQRRLRLMELSLGTNSLSKKDKERLLPRTCSCITEVVSIKEIPKNRIQVVPQKVQPQPEEEDEEDDIYLDEILSEMGYGEDDDLRVYPTDEMEEDDNISNISKTELKQMIRDIVTQTLEEDDDTLDFNEIFENLSKQ
jgi:hypothetical protein